jgi:FkbM family methyltransferase
MPSLRQLFGLSRNDSGKALAAEVKKLTQVIQEESKRGRKETADLKKAMEQRLGALGSAVEARAGTMAGMLKRLHLSGEDPKTVIDIGASDGQWTKLALEWFPRSEYLLVEAQPCHAEALAKFGEGRAQVQVAMAAAGRTKGEIHFNVSDPYGGLASTTPFEKNNLVVPVTTLDHEMEVRGLKGPFLIKFDTHGFEVPILEGAVEVLKQTRVIVMECYNFKISPDCLTFPEMCALLAGHGFRCADMADVLHREKDGALWQMDIAFVRDDAAVFADNRYT